MEPTSPAYAAKQEQSDEGGARDDHRELSEAVRSFLNLVADEAVKQILAESSITPGEAAADPEVPGGPNERRPVR